MLYCFSTKQDINNNNNNNNIIIIIIIIIILCKIWVPRVVPEMKGRNLDKWKKKKKKTLEWWSKCTQALTNKT